MIKHKISAHTITIPVRKKVAKSEFTFLMPIFAKIVVSDVANAPTKARINHNIKFLKVLFGIFLSFADSDFNIAQSTRESNIFLLT